jgi:hypothetical protein
MGHLAGGADDVVDFFDCRVAGGFKREVVDVAYAAGTRIATPSSLPSSSGNTNPTASRHPCYRDHRDGGVARYRSECMVSRLITGVVVDRRP